MHYAEWKYFFQNKKNVLTPNFWMVVYILFVHAKYCTVSWINGVWKVIQVHYHCNSWFYHKKRKISFYNDMNLYVHQQNENRKKQNQD